MFAVCMCVKAVGEKKSYRQIGGMILGTITPMLLAHLGHSGPLFALIIGAMLLPLAVVFFVLARNEKRRQEGTSDH